MTRLVRAPGRVNLIGEHTDHTSGLAMPMAISQGITIDAKSTTDGRIRLSTGSGGPDIDLPADGSGMPSRGWGRYVSAVAWTLTRFDRPPVGIRGHVQSDLQAGIGLSSSAALEVAVAVALLSACDGMPPLSPIALARALQEAEHRAVGVPSGVLDQAASLLGVEGGAVVLDCADLSVRPVTLPPGLMVLVIDSGVRRALETSGYEQRVNELSMAIPVLEGRRPADVDPAEVGRLSRDLDDIPTRRLRHVVTENERVRDLASALALGDLDATAQLMWQSHVSLRDDFEVTVPETDDLSAFLMDAGAHGARMTGGGFGGAVIALVDDDEVDRIAQTVCDRYRTAHPSRTPIVLKTQPSAGAVQLHPQLFTPSAGQMPR